MKALSNWRYYIMTALFTVGFLAIARAFGEPAVQMSDLEWFKQVLLSLSVGVPCLYVLGRLIKRWEREGKIPEFTNPKIK